MGQESFWAEIKKHEDMLAADPRSYCFAQLAELYRKIGLLDDAVATAVRGIEIHPDYIAGYVALGCALFEKGERKKARAALERVVKVTPENIIAQKLLSQLYMESDELDAAERALRMVLAQNPGEVESRLMLESLLRQAACRRPAQGDEPIEEAELIEDIAPLEDDAPLESVADLEDSDASFAMEPSFAVAPAWETEPVEELPFAEPAGFDVTDTADFAAKDAGFAAEEDDGSDEEDEGASRAAPAHAYHGAAVPAAEEESPTDAADEHNRDPLTTVTLADIYISQGFLKRAVKIYVDLLNADPGNAELRARLIELKKRIDEEDALARDEDFSGADFSPVEAAAAEPEPIPTPAPKGPTGPVEVLESWLDSIRRGRECR